MEARKWASIYKYNMTKIIIAKIFLGAVVLNSCSIQDTLNGEKLKPAIITESVIHDTDDPAIWVNNEDPSKSLIIGTDKDSDGGLYVFNLNGKIVNKVTGLKRPNNVDLGYGLTLNGQKVDFVATTERESNKVRLFSFPEMKAIGEFSVFDGEAERSPMGIALYQNPESKEYYAIVGRKSGPKDGYLWQYKLEVTDGNVGGKLVRKFGSYSGKKEIEAIAVDQELGYIYYSDEMYGIRKYHADPSKGNEELLRFGTSDFTEDIEGLSIYPTTKTTGYILASDQQADRFNVYKRENPEEGIIARIKMSTIESDGSDASAVNFGADYPKGIFVAMSNPKIFHIYDWRVVEVAIKAQQKKQ